MSSTGETPGAGGTSRSRSSEAVAEAEPRQAPSDSALPASLAADARSQGPDAESPARDAESPAPDAEGPAPDEEGPPGRARRRRWWPFVAPIAAIAVAASLVTPAGRHQWALSLFRQPGYYTALSFNKAWALPETAAWDAPLSVSFAVANHEGRAIRYRYVLSEAAVGQPGTATTLRESARVVPDGATWTVSTSVRPTCASSSCRVEVSLPGHPETIDFLVNLTFGPTAGG